MGSLLGPLLGESNNEKQRECCFRTQFFLVPRSPPKSEGGTWPVFLGGGRAASARTGMGRPFPCSQTAAQWRGVGFWEVVSFAPSLLARSVSGRAPRSPPPGPAPAVRSPADAFSTACAAPARLGVLSASASCLLPCVRVFTPRPLRPSQGYGVCLIHTLVFCRRNQCPASEAPSWGRSRDQSPALRVRVPACGLSHGAGLRARGERLELGIKK